MTIKIIRNEAGNCVNFQGADTPVYWNSCLTALAHDTNPDNINIRNNIKSDGAEAFEFFNEPFTSFVDANGDAFADVDACLDYINTAANAAGANSLNANYSGVWDTVVDITTDTSSYSNGDWFYVGVEATVDFGGTSYDLNVNDIVKFNATSSEWEVIRNANVSISEIEGSALDQYDIHVDPSYTGTVRTGSSLQPYTDLAVAIANSSAKQSILIKGEVVVPNSSSDAFVLPHGLEFYGNSSAAVRFTSYDATNGDLFHFTGTDNTQKFLFENLTIKNAGGYGIFTAKTARTEVRDCTLENNGWSGNGLNTVMPSSVTGVLGYDSSAADLQAFYAGSEASNGGAMRIQEATMVSIGNNLVQKNLRGIRVQDCGINGGGFITRNQAHQNIESGIYIAAGSLGGCHNVVAAINSTAYNANNGLLVIGGINNKFSQIEVNGNWNAGVCGWGSANLTVRDCGLYDNNRSTYNGIGNTGDAKASIQINDAYNLLGTQITYNPAFRFIAEILDTQVHYTGLGSNTDRIGFLITSAVGAIADNDKNIIKVDDVGFIGQDYAIDFSEVDLTNLRVSLGDNSYQTIGQKAVKAPLAGHYSELPFSNHIMSVPEVDIVVDTLKQSIALHEGVGGNVINVYAMNELQSVLKANAVDIIQRSSDKIQLRDMTLGNVYINGVVAGSNLSTMNDSINGAFNMDLTEYKDFIETEVGVIGSDPATFYYIESPDGVFHYPLFKTAAEANAVDVELGGTGGGSSHTHTYADDLTGTTWYMPNTSNHMDDSSAPVNGLYTAPNGGTVASVVWNIQSTDTDTNYLPTFSNITYNVQEGSAVNIQYKAAGMTESFNLTGVPAGYADDGFAIIGTAEDITNGAGNSVQHVINVTKANAFGSVQGTITINVKADLAGNEFTIVDQNGAIKFTQDGGATVLDFNTVTFNAGSTYKFFLDGSTLQTNDVFDITDANGTGLTGNEGVSQTGGSGTGYAGTYFNYVIPSDVGPSKFLKFIDGATNTTYPTVPMNIAGSTYTANPTGITLEGPSANQTGSNVMDQYDHGWISLNETLAAGERLVLDNAFFTDFFGEVQSGSTVFAIGLKGSNWTNTKVINGNGTAASGLTFAGNSYIVGQFSSGGGYTVTLWPVANGIVGNSMSLNTTALMNSLCAFLEIDNSQDNIKIGFGRNGYLGITAGDESTVTYDNWNSYKGQSGTGYGSGHNNLDVMMSFWTYNGGDIDGAEIDWTGISEVAIPTPPTTNATSWTKAVHFGSGGGYSAASNLVQAHYHQDFNPLRMNGTTGAVGLPDQAGSTVRNVNGRPWATSVVFKSDGKNLDQHIWHGGNGSGGTGNEVYLRLSSIGSLYFGWGKPTGPVGANVNECLLATNISTSTWYGVYVGFTGARFTASDATASNLAQAFDIRMMSSSDSFANVGSNLSTVSNWASTGIQTTEGLTGGFWVGRASGSKSFYGKVASMVVTALRITVYPSTQIPMPSDAEIKKMIADPKGWEDDYRDGELVREYDGVNAGTYNPADYNYGYLSNFMWLMGDGTLDSYTNGIRNDVRPTSDVGITKLVFTNMSASDIVNVSISGLS